MKVIIIDDERASIETLSQKLEKYDNVTLCGTAENGMKGIMLFKQEQPDVLFLDVELPDMTGLEFLDQMRHFCRKECKVIIYTAHAAYMLPAFRGKAFDFLLKPVDDEDLKKVMQRVYTEDYPESATGMKDTEKLLLYVNATDFRVVSIQDVGLFQYNHELRSWEVLVAGRKEPVRLKRTVNNDSLLMMDNRFVQVSQRHIINIDYLMEVNDSICLLYPPFDKLKDIKVGRTFRKQLTERFNAL